MNSGMSSSILVERTRRLGSSQNDKTFFFEFITSREESLHPSKIWGTILG